MKGCIVLVAADGGDAIAAGSRVPSATGLAAVDGDNNLPFLQHQRRDQQYAGAKTTPEEQEYREDMLHG